MNDNKYNDVLKQEELMVLAESTTSVALDHSVKAKIKSNVFKRISASCPDGGNTIRKESEDWQILNDFISIKVLHQDFKQRLQTSLWRLKPGARIKGHVHQNDEECYVIEGSVGIENHKLHAGDYHVMKKGSIHADIISEEGALLFLKHDMHESQIQTGI